MSGRDAMTDADLTAIEARLREATPGPWPIVPNREYPRLGGLESIGPIQGHYIGHEIDGYADDPDIILISNAPTDIAALLTEVRRLRRELAQRLAPEVTP